MEHTLDNCQPRTETTFECMCEDGYFWDGSACINPCDMNPCGAHSDGNCIAKSLDVYYCDCVDGYSWNGGSCKEYSTGLTIGKICTGREKVPSFMLKNVSGAPKSLKIHHEEPIKAWLWLK